MTVQEVLDVEYAGSALSHLGIIQLAPYALLGLRSCSPTCCPDIHSHMFIHTTT